MWVSTQAGMILTALLLSAYGWVSECDTCLAVNEEFPVRIDVPGATARQHTNSTQAR